MSAREALYERLTKPDANDPDYAIEKLLLQSYFERIEIGLDGGFSFPDDTDEDTIMPRSTAHGGNAFKFAAR